jgi:hypothetical protein
MASAAAATSFASRCRPFHPEFLIGKPAAGGDSQSESPELWIGAEV